MIIGFMIFFVFLLFIKNRIEYFEDLEYTDALQAIKKMLDKYSTLLDKLHKKKIHEKDNAIQIIQDDLKEMDYLYRKKITNERQVTYNTILTQIKNYIAVFNKIVIDYNIDMLDIKVKDILGQGLYDRPNTTASVYKSTDTYEGEY